MRSVSLSNRTGDPSVAALFTDGESTFRNAKLRPLTLIAYKAFADAAGKGSLLVITLVAARRLSPWAFGVFGLGTTLGWLLSVIADFGIQMHVARAVARVPDAAAVLLARWWRVRALATAVAVGVLTLLLLLWRADAGIVVPLLGFAVAYASTSLVEFLNYFYRGLSRSDIESTLTIAQRTATLVLAVGVLLWRPGVTALALAMLLPAIATALWSVRIAARLRPPATGLAIPGDSFIRDVFPIGLGIVLSALYFRIDVVLVELWVGTEAVASYNAVFRVVDALRLFPAAVLAVILPVAVHRDQPQAGCARVDRADRIWCNRRSAAVVTADRLVPLLFGERYASAVPTLRILALSFPLLSLNLALTHQLVGWNRQRAYAAVCAIALAVNLTLNAWLIPAFSIDGAAWATLGTELCLTGGCAAALWVRS
jgi:O-antigen/teichoic acid export membrane protein